MLLDPGHNRGYGYRVSAEKNMAALNHSTHIDRSCWGGIFTWRFVSLLIKKYQQDKT